MKPLAALIIEDLEQEVILLRHDLAKKYDPLETEWVYDEPGITVALKHKVWDVILCDYGLPLAPWPRALELAMEHAPFTPFLVLSRLSEADQAKILKDGADGFIDRRVGSIADELYRRIEREREKLSHQRAGDEAMRGIQDLAKRK